MHGHAAVGEHQYVMKAAHLGRVFTLTNHRFGAAIHGQIAASHVALITVLTKFVKNTLLGSCSV